MAERWECAHATGCEVGLMTARSLEQEYAHKPDVFALTIGDPWGSAYAIFGTRQEIEAWLRRAWDASQHGASDSRWLENNPAEDDDPEWELGEGVRWE